MSRTRNYLMYSLMASVALPTVGYAQSQSSQGMMLEEIVVTARKRDESIFKIPVSVSAFSQSDLKRSGVSNPEELSSFVAGMDFQGSTATGGRENPTIRFRGINQQIITPATQVGALFWDGSYIGSGGGFLPLGDVERVEVIKGPQTAYFGRNTFSGAINIIPKLPTDVWESDVTLDWSPSQTDEYTIEVGTGGPITDKVGVRIWAGYEKDGGDFKTQREKAPYGVSKDTSVSGTLTFEASEDLNLKFTGYYTKADDNGTYLGIDATKFGVPGGQCNIVYTGQYLNNATGEKTPFTRNIADFAGASWCGKFPDGKNAVAPYTVTPGPGDAFPSDNNLLALNNLHPLMSKYGIVRKPDGKLGANDQTYRVQFSGDYDIADHTLSFQMSRASTGNTNVRDFWYGVPSVPNRVFILGGSTMMRETYYEARIASPQDNRLRYLLGVSDYTQRYRQGDLPVSPTQVTTGAGATVDFQDNTTTAVFGSVDYDITDDLTFSAEMRYTDETSNVLIQGDPGQPCGFSPVCDLENSYTDFIPRVILSYSPFEGATTYVSYSESSLLGLPTQAGYVNAVAPEVLPDDAVASFGDFTGVQRNTQYEWGWKQQADWWNATLAVFYAKWDNQPFAAVILLPTGGTTSLANPGDADYKGFDLEVNAAPVDWLSVRGTLAYTHAKSITFASRGSNESSLLASGSLSVVNDGNDVRNTPEWTASLSPTILGEADGRAWFFRTDFLYESPYWADYSEYNRVGDKLVINARAGIDITEGTSIELYGKNLTKNRTLATTGGTTTGPGGSRKIFTELYQKREFGVRLTSQF